MTILKNRQTRIFIYTFIAIISWSTVATAFKIALREVSNYELLLIAAPVATLFFAVVMTIRSQWSTLTYLPIKQWIIFALTGLLNPFLYYLILFKAYDLLPAQIAQPLNCLWPVVLVILLAIISHEKIPKFKYIGIFISLVGVLLISNSFSLVGTGIQLSPTGIVLALTSAVFWAVFWVFNKTYMKIDSITALFLSFFFASVYLLTGSFFVEINFSLSKGVYAAIYTGLFEMGIPFTFFSLALKQTNNPVLINQLCLLFPFISLIFIHFVLGETIYFTTASGLFLIISGILFNEYFSKKP